MTRPSLAALALVTILASRAGASTTLAPAPPGVPTLDESAAYPEDASPVRLNPAGTSTRYPSEFAFSFLDRRFGRDSYAASLEQAGLRLALAGAQSDPPAFSLGLAGGPEPLRSGLAATWIPDPGGRRRVDWKFGLLSRPAPWLSLGAVGDHLARPLLAGVRPERDYTVALGLRPLALDRGRAHTWGTRLTLTADARLDERSRAKDSDLRFGGEFELVPGLALRGAVLNHDRGFQLGVSLLGVRSGSHAQAAYDRDGRPLGTVYTGSVHDAEDRTLFMARTDRRVAAVLIGGALGDDALSGFTFEGPTSVTPVAPIHRQLERALEDPLTRGVLLDLHGASNMAQLEEIRHRIEVLRKLGKPVVAYLEDGAGRGDLYLASACDRVVTTPEALFLGLGLMAERRYYRQVLADWGVRFDRASYGRYKSAFRNFSVDSTSDADRESIEQQLDAVQELFVSTVAAGRGMDRERLLGLLDGRAWRPRDVQRAGLVDSIGYREDALRLLGSLTGLGAKPRVVNLARRPVAKREWTVPTRIAIVYAAGSIETGKSGSDLLLGPYMGSETIARQVEAAFRRPDVQAVVLRVESGGGSSLGSDLINHALARMKRETKKPLIVSMGGVAASGGYDIAVPGDRLFADRFTRTGSIGVLTVRPSLEGWYRKHQVREDDFVRGPAMRGWSQGHDWDAAEQASADSSIYSEYRDFVALVAKGRGLSWDEVDRVAQGRVWMGEDARERKLVDQIGGLEAALAEARRRAGIPADEKIRPVEFRRPQPFILQRLIGSAVVQTLDRNLRLPEPGRSLYWDEGVTLEP